MTPTLGNLPDGKKAKPSGSISASKLAGTARRVQPWRVSSGCVHLNRLHFREPQKNAAVARSRDAVSGFVLDSERDVSLTGEANRLRDVLNGFSIDNRRWKLFDNFQPRRSLLVIFAVAARYNRGNLLSA